MLTIKLPYTCNDDLFYSTLNELRLTQSAFIRSAYQLFHQGLNQYQVQQDKELQNKFSLGSWFKQCALMEAKATQTRNKENKVIFGGAKNFELRLKNKISADQWKSSRLSNLISQGEASKCGNRHFTLDIEETNSIIFKPQKGVKFNLILPKLKRNFLTKLLSLEKSTKLKIQPYQISLNEKYIFISFEEAKVIKPLTEVIENRYLGIDLNPTSVGLSIIENNPDQTIKVIHTQEFLLNKIFNKIKSLNVASSDPKFKHLNNKLNFETIEISKEIVNLALQFNCKRIFIEDLNFKDKTCENKGLNRHNKNLWKRGKITQNLQKRCYLNSLTFYEVSPQWSSVIGNLMYPYTDPINASIEIARRGAQVIFEKTKSKRKFYPLFSVDILKDQWKEYFKEFKSWKEIFSSLKNSKLKYRVLPDELNIKVFSLNCKQSLVFYHTCT